MSARFKLRSNNVLASLCVWAALWAPCFESRAEQEVDAREIRAASLVGSTDVAVLSLIRELSAWKERALRAEELLTRAGVSPGAPSSAFVRNNPDSERKVLSTIEEERVVILSFGRDKGVMQGALVAVGKDVVAKVIESRETISAAVVDSSYKGKLVALEGQPVKLAVR